MPERIQLSRAKGWRMPPNTVKVDRSTKWGNPFPIGKEGPFERVAPDAEGAAGFFRDMCRDSEVMMAARYPFHREIRAELRGKNLACWCPIHRNGEYAPCHADVLLSLANGIPLEDVINENLRRSEREAV